jgi:hypothetical protein
METVRQYKDTACPAMEEYTSRIIKQPLLHICNNQMELEFSDTQLILGTATMSLYYIHTHTELGHDTISQ